MKRRAGAITAIGMAAIFMLSAACGNGQGEPTLSAPTTTSSPEVDPTTETPGATPTPVFTPFFIEPRLFSWVEAVADREGWEIVGQCPYYGVEMGWCYFPPIVGEDIVHIFIGRTGSGLVFTLTLQATEGGELVEISLEPSPGDVPPSPIP